MAKKSRTGKPRKGPAANKRARAPKRAAPKAAKKSATKKARAKAPRSRTTSRSQTRSKPRAKRAPLGIGTLHVDFLTYKSTQVRKFYGEFLELKTEFRDMDGIDYLVVRTSSTSSIGFMPPHPDMRGEQPAPREPGLYFMVEDIDATYRYLLEKGATFVRPPETMPWGHRVLTTTDPEGRTVMLAGEAEPED